MIDLTGTLRIEISSDGQRATAQPIRSPAPRGVRLRDLTRIIEAAGVRHGIDGDALDAFLQAWKRGEVGDPVVIARGDAPIPGRRADLTRVRPPARPRGGNAVQLLPLYVQRGEDVFQESPSSPGKPGRDVCGSRQEAPVIGTGVLPRAGAGIEVIGDRWRAQATGFLVVADGCIAITPTLVHSRGLPPGRYEWAGDADLAGEIAAGTRLTLGGSLRVAGAVGDDVEIYCGGDVELRGEIVGTGSRVRAGGNIRASAVVGASLLAGGDVLTVAEVRGASVRCHGLFEGSAPGCVLVGTRIDAVRGARVRTVEDGTGPRTTITVGVSAWHDDEYRALEGEIQRWQASHRKLYDAFYREFAALLEDRTRIHRAPSAVRRRFEASEAETLREQARIDTRISELRTRQARLQEQRSRDERAVIHVLGTACPGAHLRVRGRSLTVGEDGLRDAVVCLPPESGRLHALPTALYRSSDLSCDLA